MTEEEISRNWAESRRAYEYEKKREEEQNLYEYGTSDPKKIAEIKEERKKESKAKRNLWAFFVITVLLIYMAIGGIARCTGSGNMLFDNNDEYQYRHTDRIH